MSKKVKIIYPIGSFAPGNYMQKCINCKNKFTGDKYAQECEPCAINRVNASNNKVIVELEILKQAFEKIKIGFKTIDESLSK